MGMGVLETIDPADYPAVETKCLRCGAPVSQRFAGICGQCTSELRGRYADRERQELDSSFEPKLNVTPNAVALKDD